jgi:predicted PP-loop superfamily ATPase
MLPGVNLNEAASKAQQAISGTADSLDGVTATARQLGINRQAIDRIYNQVGGTMQAKMICRMLGTTPEAIKADAEKIVSGQAPAQTTGTKTRFPRLK